MIETDYLVIGAGAAGMAFVDELITSSEDAEVLLVDRRDEPGGHWNDAYPFVRLHQPSALYGVNSRRLGEDRIEQSGPEAGLYERATAAQVCDYYQRVLRERLLPSGQVRFAGMCDYLGAQGDGHRLRCRVTGAVTTVGVRRRLVDASYLQAAVPTTHTPSFSADEGMRLVTPSGLARLGEHGSGYTVLGAGKTAMDTCTWLLEHGVAPGDIRWVRPREPWVIDRAWMQPLALVASVVEWVSYQLEAAAAAADIDELFRGLEDRAVFQRLDPEHEPGMCHYATVGAAELERLRQIEDVVRLGRLRHLGTDSVTLEAGSVPARPGHVYIDASAAGLRRPPARAIFEPGRITIQTVRSGLMPFNAALIAFVEATWHDDTERNRLCPANRYPDHAVDWVGSTLVSQRAAGAWAREPELVSWLERSRLNLTRGIAEQLDDPRADAAVQRIAVNTKPALANLAALQAQLGDHRDPRGAARVAGQAVAAG